MSSQQQLNELIIASMEGSMDDASFEELKKVLEQDPEARQHYADMISLNIMMRGPGGESAIQQTNAQVGQDIDSQEIMRERVELDQLYKFIKETAENGRKVDKVKDLAENQLREFLEQQKSSQSDAKAKDIAIKFSLPKKRMLKYVAVAASLLMFVGLWGFLGDRQIPVAALTNISNAKWEIEPQELLFNQEYKLISGLAEIEFYDGAKVVLEGPVNITLESANGANLTYGKLAATVPEKAKGFTIKTPCAKFIDLGTEFGVSVDDSSSSLSVFYGQVAVVMPGDSFDESYIVNTGEQVLARQDDSALVDITASIEYVRDIPPVLDCTEPMLTINKDVLDQKIHEYIIWEGATKNRLSSDAMINRDQKYIRFDGDKTDFAINKNNEVTPRVWGYGYSWSFWFKPDVIDQQVIFKVVPSDNDDTLFSEDGDDAEVLHGLCIKNNKEKQKILSYIFLTHNRGIADSISVGHEIESKPLTIQDEWIHVAGVISPDVVKLYINGVCVGEHQLPPNHIAFGDESDLFIMGRNMYFNEGIFKGSRFKRFKGYVDDIRFYECELTSEDVLEIYSTHKIK